MAVIPNSTMGQVIGFAMGESLMLIMIVVLYAYRTRTLSLLRLDGAGLSFSRILLNMAYVHAILFQLSVLLMAMIPRTETEFTCYLAIFLCFVFYVCGKVLLYIFMCERLRAIRETVVDRSADVLWQICFWGILSVFGQIAIIRFFYPMNSMKQGYCTTALPYSIIIPILVLEVGSNTFLSAVFYFQSRVLASDFLSTLLPPNIRRYFHPRIIEINGVRAFAMSRSLEEMPTVDPPTAMMAEISRKTLVTSILILFSTVLNLALLLHYHGHEHDWLYFLLCSIDNTWCITCLTYLTGLPTHDETYHDNARNAQEQHVDNLPRRMAGNGIAHSSHPEDVHKFLNDRHLFTSPFYPPRPVNLESISHQVAPEPNDQFPERNFYYPSDTTSSGPAYARRASRPISRQVSVNRRGIARQTIEDCGPGPSLRRQTGTDHWVYNGD